MRRSRRGSRLSITRQFISAGSPVNLQVGSRLQTQGSSKKDLLQDMGRLWGLIPDDPDDTIWHDNRAMNKNFKYREILLRHQLIFLVLLHPEACSGLRLKRETAYQEDDTATDLRMY